MTMQRNFSAGPIVPLESAAQSSDMGFDFNRFLRLIILHYRIILGTVIAVVTITLINVANVVPQYDATAMVLIDQRQNKITDPNEVISNLTLDPVTVDNQLQILQSRELMGHVIDRLRLDKRPPLAVPPGLLSVAKNFINPSNWFGHRVATKPIAPASQRREDLINMLIGGESVTAVDMSSAMQITYRTANPQDAADIANAIVDAYVEQQVTAKSDATQKTSQWLADRLQQLSAQMQTSDAEVQEYKAANNITETQNGQSVLGQQLAQLNAQLVTARSDLAELQAKYAQAKQLQASGRAEDLSQIFQAGLIEQLRTQQAELLRQKAQYLTIYGPKHPKMLDLISQLNDIDSKIADEVNRVVATVANDVAVSGARVQSLEGSLAKLEAETTVEGNAGVKLTELEARASSAHQLYQAFLEKFKETQGQEGIQTADSRVISRAVIPDHPSVPNKTRDLEMAMAGGLFLGLLFAVAAERFDGGLQTAEQLEHLTNLPVLSTVPELEGKSDEPAANRAMGKPLSSFAEAIRGLQLAIEHSNVDRKPKIILVTSSVPDEGKTTIALSLARVCARGDKKVLLIDCDFRRPSIRNALGLEQKSMRASGSDSAIEQHSNGFLDVLSGMKPLSEAVIADPHSSVRCLLTLRIPTDPTDVLVSKAMSRFLENARKDWDYVIIDSAPILPVNDTKILASYVDTIVFVVRWKKTPKEAIASAARALSDIQARVAGIVVSRANLKRHRYYAQGYQSYYNYDKYYSN